MENNIKQFLIAKGMTQSELASKVGVSQSLMKLWICGERIPKVNHAIRMARALDCSVEDLFNVPAVPSNLFNNVL